MNTQSDTKKINVCMACKCPCEMHKEHNHDEKEDGEGSVKKCEICGREQKADSSFDCGCK